MEKSTEMYAMDYLQAKKNLLQQCIYLTVQVGQHLGNIPETHRLLGQRKQLLGQLAQLDQQYGTLLAGYLFSEEELEPVALLAEQMWDIDDHITEAMRSNKTDIQDFLNELNLEAIHQQIR